MGKAIFIFLAVLVTSQTFALNIREIRISMVSPNLINVSVDTEAEELYYFHSALYTISENEITIKACYVSGFGSTIEFLNNNFEIPIDTAQSTNYTVTIKIYYTDLKVLYAEENLQDQMTGLFSTPFSGPIVLEEVTSQHLILFPNPVNEYLFFSEEVAGISIHDLTGRLVKNLPEASNCIDLSDTQSGPYFIEFHKQRHTFRRIIVKK